MLCGVTESNSGSIQNTVQIDWYVDLHNKAQLLVYVQAQELDGRLSAYPK
jgi:hypothetical protein